MSSTALSSQIIDINDSTLSAKSSGQLLQDFQLLGWRCDGNQPISGRHGIPSCVELSFSASVSPVAKSSEIPNVERPLGNPTVDSAAARQRHHTRPITMSGYYRLGW